jgi:hypothetical protein
MYTDFNKNPQYSVERKSFTSEFNCAMRTNGRTGGRDEANSKFLQSLCETRLEAVPIVCLRRGYTFEHSVANHVNNTFPFYVMRVNSV